MSWIVWEIFKNLGNIKCEHCGSDKVRVDMNGIPWIRKIECIGCGIDIPPLKCDLEKYANTNI